MESHNEWIYLSNQLKEALEKLSVPEALSITDWGSFQAPLSEMRRMRSQGGGGECYPIKLAKIGDHIDSFTRSIISASDDSATPCLVWPSAFAIAKVIGTRYVPPGIYKDAPLALLAKFPIFTKEDEKRIANIHTGDCVQNIYRTYVEICEVITEHLTGILRFNSNLNNSLIDQQKEIDDLLSAYDNQLASWLELIENDGLGGPEPEPELDEP